MMAARARTVGIRLTVPVLLVALWWVTSADSASPFYPPLSDVLRVFRQTWLFSHFASDVVPSLERMFGGYALAIVVGVGIGVLLGRVRWLARALNPAVQFSRAIPGTALVPVSVVLFGIGDVAKIELIAFVCVFPILLNTIDAVRSIDPQLEDVARSYRLSRAQRVFGVLLPSAAPQIFAGMRTSLGIAFIIMIITELFAATSGIGFITLNAKQTFHVPEMWSGMMLLGLLGAGSNAAFVVLQRRVLRWHHGISGRT